MFSSRHSPTDISQLAKHKEHQTSNNRNSESNAGSLKERQQLSCVSLWDGTYRQRLFQRRFRYLSKHVFEDTAPPNDESFSHTAATTKQEIFFDASASSKKEEGQDKVRDQSNHFYRNECAFSFHNINALSASHIQRNNKPNCLNERLNNTSDGEFSSADVTMGKKQQYKNGKRQREHDICAHLKRPEKNVGGSYSCQ